MLAIVNVIVPVFSIMLAGYLCGRLGVLGEGSSHALNAFVFNVALPALFFVAMAQVPVSEALNLPFIAAYFGGILAVFALSMVVATFVFPNRPSALALHAMSAVFSNTGYMGIPLLLVAFGDPARMPGIISTVINGAVLMGLVTVIMEIDAQDDGRPLAIAGRVVGGVVKSPLIVSAVAGLLFSALEIPLPTAVQTFCNLLGATAGPCALFAIGLFMVGKSVTTGLPEVLWVTVLKLVAQPLVTYWLAYYLLPLTPVEAASAVVLAALPTGALTFVLAQRYNVYLQRSVAVILISTVASVVTLALLFIYLEIG
ncbi:MAG: AEC family transporter [Rhodospirillales bacterium]